LLNWLRVNEEVSLEWPADVLRVRISEYLDDGVLDQDEKDELLDLLRRVSGENGRIAPANFSTAMCFDAPLPELVFDGQVFCFTGQFVYGSRPECELAVRDLGGRVVSGPSAKNETIVVVGLLASRDWKHGTHGTKIIKAMQLRDAGHPVSIVPENHWTEQLVRAINL
ncbi:MAG: BRCT domain-containing protein, partial [Desulfovibrio sp.]